MICVAFKNQTELQSIPKRGVKMANFTAKAIKETFIELLEERPLSQITVKDICEKCEINRNTFYYHYQDLPALIEKIIEEEVKNIIEKYPSVSSIVECFDALVEFASSKKRAIMHIFRSVNREVFDNNLRELSGYLVFNYIDSAVDDIPISEGDKKTVSTYYKSVFFGLVTEWLNCEMSEDFAREIRRIFLLKKDFAKEVADLLRGQV